MIKINKYSDIKKINVPEVVKSLEELFTNLFDNAKEYGDYAGSLETFDAEKDGQGGAVVFQDADYADFDKSMVSCGLNSGEYDLYEVSESIGKDWLALVYTHTNESGISIYLQKSKIPEQYKKVFIKESKTVSETINKTIKQRYF
jgi:hypothetical protein